jgi:hypothetical protein
MRIVCILRRSRGERTKTTGAKNELRVVAIKLVLISLAALFGGLTFGSAHGQSWTPPRNISQVVVLNIGPSVDTQYYLYTTEPSGWGASGCPSAGTAQVRPSYGGAKELFVLALLAKAQGLRIRLLGTCEGGDYLTINWIVLDPAG